MRSALSFSSSEKRATVSSLRARRLSRVVLTLGGWDVSGWMVLRERVRRGWLLRGRVKGNGNILVVGQDASGEDQGGHNLLDCCVVGRNGVG